MRGPHRPRKLLSAKTVIALQRAPRLENRQTNISSGTVAIPAFLSGGKRRH